MIISLIAILTSNSVIGKENSIPWYFSIDRVWFKYHTFNKPIIMGRKTFESIGKKPISNVRLNIVLSNQFLFKKVGNVIFVNTLDAALSLTKNSNEVMIIGGSSVYNIFLPYSNRMYLTYINCVYSYGDAWFPKYNQKDWKCVLDIVQLCRVNKNYRYTLNFKIFDRINDTALQLMV